MNYPIQSVLGNTLELVGDAVDYFVDYSDCKYGETCECLVEFVDMPQSVNNRDLRGIISCDVSELEQFVTLPGISRILVDTINGFRPIWIK